MENKVYRYIKSYQRSSTTEYRSPLLQISYENAVYRFSIEKLAYRLFFEDDYKFYSSGEFYSSNQYKIILFINGSNTISLGSKKVICNEGTVLLFSPGKQPVIAPKSKGEVMIAVLSFDFTDDKGNFLKLPFSSLLNYYADKNINEQGDLFVLDTFYKESLGRLFEHLYSLLSADSQINTLNPQVCYLSLGETMIKIFQILVYHAYGCSKGTNSRDNTALSEIVKRIEASYNQKLTISELAKEACLSESHFLHAFKEAYGISPIQYQLQLRVNEAKNLLALTSLSCKEIASIIGINNIYYFSRLFKKFTGMSPTDYRNKYKIL